jgi:hypothetical protein
MVVDAPVVVTPCCPGYGQRVHARFFRLWRLGQLAIGLAAIHLLSACPDPCTQLAQRICNCEPTTADRRACVEERVNNQRDKIELSDADKEFCADKLETCDCRAIDENDLEKCGFVPEDGSDT